MEFIKGKGDYIGDAFSSPRSEATVYAQTLFGVAKVKVELSERKAIRCKTQYIELSASAARELAANLLACAERIEQNEREEAARRTA